MEFKELDCKSIKSNRLLRFSISGAEGVGFARSTLVTEVKQLVSNFALMVVMKQVVEDRLLGRSQTPGC